MHALQGLQSLSQACVCVQTRAYPRTPAGKRMAIHFGAWDSCVSLTAAFFVNAAILILAAAAFFVHGNTTVACERLFRSSPAASHSAAALA